MQTRKLTDRTYRLRPTLAFAGGTLLLLLSGAAQAQMTRSRPQPSSRSDSGGNTEAHSTGSSDSSSSRPSTSTGPIFGGENRRGGQSSGVSRSGNVNFGVLFPTAKSGGILSGGSKNPLPRVIVFGGGIFDDPDFPKSSDDSKSNSETKSTTDRSTGEDKIIVAHSAQSTPVEVSSYDRYKQSQEASAASHPIQSTHDNSQILWPYDYLSPFRGYSPYEVIWWPGDFPNSIPDTSVFFPDPDGPVILGWPNYAPQNEAPRDEPNRNYRIGEKTKPRQPVDIQPALDAIQRAFQEEHPRLLAYHLQRKEPMRLSEPGQPQSLVRSEQLLDRLATLFAERDTITMEIDPPQALDADRFDVTAWHVYRGSEGTIYRARIRFVLQVQDDKPILTDFEMD